MPEAKSVPIAWMRGEAGKFLCACYFVCVWAGVGVGVGVCVCVCARVHV